MTKLKRVALIFLYLVSMASIVSHAQDKDIASLIQQFNHKDEDVKQYARKSLIEMGEAAVPALIVELNHENDKVREKIVDILFFIKNSVPDNKNIVRALVKALKDDSATVRSRTMSGFLYDSEELVPEVISGLVQALYYGSPFFGHSDACHVLLWGGGKRNPHGQTALIEALHSNEWSLRYGAASAYGFMIRPNRYGKLREKPRPEVKKAMFSALAEGLTHPGWKTREHTIIILKGLRSAFDEARQALEALPAFGIISQTIKDGQPVVEMDPDALNSLNTDGITFKFTRPIHGNWTITIQPVDAEPLGWHVEKSSHSITITPKKGQELVKNHRYRIQLRDVKDILGNQVDAEIEFSTEVPLIKLSH